MKYSRRDLGLLLPALAAASASAQNIASNTAGSAAPAAENSVEKLPVMKTRAFKYDEIPVTTNGKNTSKRMFTAKTHTGFKIESHSSDIAPTTCRNEISASKETGENACPTLRCHRSRFRIFGR